MIEITIKTEDEVALKKLLQFVKKIGLEITTSTPATIDIKVKNKKVNLPSSKTPKIQWAKEPEKAKELFGIWKDAPLTPHQLRSKAWGNRL